MQGRLARAGTIKQARLEPCGSRSLQVFTGAVTNMQNGLGGNLEQPGRSLKNASIRLVETQFAGHENCFKPRGQFEPIEQWPNTCIPIGDRCDLQSSSNESLKCGQNIGMNPPAMWVIESVVNRIEKRFVDDAQPLKCRFHDLAPFRQRIAKRMMALPRAQEPCIQKFGRK